MSRTVAMRFHTLPGSRAGVGRTAARTLIADRPDGIAGGEFNDLYKDANIEAQPDIAYVAHTAAIGAHAVKDGSIAEIEAGIREARERRIPPWWRPTPRP